MASSSFGARRQVQHSCPTSAEWATKRCDVSVVVPTFNERGNIREIVARLERVLAGLAWEVIFVDDASPDGTADLVREIASTDRRVRLIYRHDRRGLSSAVVEGALAASAEVVAVMDGDLQHDETVLPQLYLAVASGRDDIASASRFLAHDAAAGLSSSGRVKLSNTGIDLANSAFGLNMTDPLTGFFAIRRRLVEEALPNLSGEGFKILIDLITALKPRPQVREFGFQFRPRLHGESKLDKRVMYDFLIFMLSKKLQPVMPVPSRFLSFAIIDTIGIAVHLLIVMLMMSAGSGFVVGQLVGTLVAMAFNYAVNNELTYSNQKLRGHRFYTGFSIFCALCSVGMVANVGMASLLHERYAEISYVLPALAGVIVTVGWNYAATQAFVWGRKVRRARYDERRRRAAATNTPAALIVPPPTGIA